jgi:tripartite-type tricarboxylate transporter receptor subunit TctC
MSLISRRAVIAGLAGLAVSSGRAGAEEQTLKIIYPYSAGAAPDAVARLIAEHLQKSLGRAVIVDNRVGAGGRIAARAVKDAPANGTELLFASAAQITLQPHLYRDLGYDPFVDFVPISQTIKADLALAVGNQVPARSIKELIGWFRANPAQAAYGSPGAGTTAHFAGIVLARSSGLELRHIAYRGTPAALPDVLAGRVPLYIATVGDLIEQHKNGALRILASAETVRSAFLPDIPTLRESGFDIEAPGWFGFYAPARTPKDILDRLEKAIILATQASDVRTKILAIGFQPTGTTGAELDKIQRAQFEHWGPIVKASGFKADE